LLLLYIELSSGTHPFSLVRLGVQRDSSHSLTLSFLELTVGNNGYVVAVEAFTGARLWSVSLPGSGYRIVTMLDIGGVIYAASNGMFYGLDRQTGKVLWTEGSLSISKQCVPRPSADPTLRVGLAGMSYMSTCLSVDGMITDSNSEQPFVQEEEAVAAQRSAAR
jgi:outer membrane protein assembly factor BamB